jgi:two-component system OmpR family sensor kinase
VVYLTFSQTLMQRSDLLLSDALAVFAREVNAERLVRGSPELSIGATAREIRFRNVHFIVRDSSGRVIDVGRADTSGGAAAGPARDAEVLKAVEAAQVASGAITVEGPDGGDRVITRTIDVDGHPYLLSGVLSLSDVEAVLARMRLLFLVAIPLLLAGSALGAYLLAARGLAPVQAMSTRASEITASNLYERLPVVGATELTALARVVNELLDRLEGAFAQQRRFMADASHELRTPTAILRTEAEVTLSRPQRTEAEYRESVGVMLQAVQRLSRIVDDLFLLARADAGHLEMRREPLYLEELVHDVTRSVEQIAERRGVKVTLKSMTQAPFEGDPDLLGRAILNLLDNAIKYSPSGGAVWVEMAEQNGSHAVSVIDEGPGIPGSDLEAVFERFHRGEIARERKAGSLTEGAGLGLAIARQIVVGHGGSLAVASSRPGRTEFRLLLPAREG